MCIPTPVSKAPIAPRILPQLYSYDEIFTNTNPRSYPSPVPGGIRPNGVRSLDFSTRLAYPSRLDPITRTRSNTCDPLNVSAQRRMTATASCLSLVLSPAIASMDDGGCPAAGPPKDGSIGTANSVSSSIRRTISRRLFSSADTGGSLGPIDESVSSHLDKRTAHSKLQTTPTRVNFQPGDSCITLTQNLRECWMLHSRDFVLAT